MTHVLRTAVVTDVGRRRRDNEDTAYVGERLQAVADGMGGHAGGEVASGIAIAVLSELDGHDGADPAAALTEAVAEIGRRLDEQAPAGAGTTLTALLWSGPRFVLAHLGDSRCYRLRDGDLEQLSRDHTLVQDLLDEGRITAEEAFHHPRRAILVRALQAGSASEPDLLHDEAVPGDRYLLCSDGLTDVVPDTEIVGPLAGEDDPEAAARRLVELANDGGGPDNITCVVIDYEG
ncbi:PP2C family protein-serine/threonine phosphatase [Amycolatopsis suaedae]|uniref:Serine/threonine-protein phosphatase n=1 Tax=Amycolatopsis suaedae TaxID=2510978 RepID=A0A4V2EL19_9PSEU|nr:protein phosphatase 2C domain-containing protein [Amycolatopsis suaedae]RZQ60025.1 serine/threonine-protein phosphatase [Amycolatopsis suaedae]